MLKIEHLTGLKDLKRQDLDEILDVAEGLEDICKGKTVSKILEDKAMATFFYEPSTRTRLSFEIAMQRLGGMVVSMADAKSTSSVWKGESLHDTIKTIDNYCDVIVLRHPEAGAAEEAASYSQVPVLNAGDGTNEHPSQGLLDMLTIRRERGTLDGLKVALVGDLKHTRSTNSLTLGLSNYEVSFHFASPPGFETSDWILEKVKKLGRQYTQFETIQDAIADVDVVYVCRIQKERLKDPGSYDAIKGSYILDRKTLEENVTKPVTVLHHLPRVGELATDVDSYPGAAYFRQPFNGVLVRASLLALVFERVP
jgi:aspartate carbamoyltransferase catalytic subunit